MIVNNRYYFIAKIPKLNVKQNENILIFYHKKKYLIIILM